VANFTVAGTIRFGVEAMDRGAMIADIAAVRAALDMEDAAGEILGFFADFLYRDGEAKETAARFNATYNDDPDEFAPVMDTLSSQAGMADLLAMMRMFSGLVLVVFIAVMSIVLWNAGLMGSLRRYGEIGVRLAIGESKPAVYRSLLAEAFLVGLAGSVVGTLAGLGVGFYLQEVGIDISGMMPNATVVIDDVLRARITPVSVYIGFVPGLLATFFGAAISGLGVFKRQTAMLAKELGG
jgi:putative ABC transport system permease protein